MSDPSFTLNSAAPAFMVRDLDKMAAFYCDLLGMEVVFMNEGVYAVLRCGDVQLHLGHEHEHFKAGQSHAFLFVDNVDALYEHVKTRTKIVHPIKDQAYGLRDFLMEDPEGNRIGMGQRL